MDASTLPAANMNGAYLAEAIADERALLALTGWLNLYSPSDLTPMCWVTGTHRRAKGHTARGAKTFCPRFRRTNDAFELIALCEMMITVTQHSAIVSCGGGGATFCAKFAEHPSPDEAIRYAMCKAAIAYLKVAKASL